MSDRTSAPAADTSVRVSQPFGKQTLCRGDGASEGQRVVENNLTDAAAPRSKIIEPQ